MTLSSPAYDERPRYMSEPFELPSFLGAGVDFNRPLIVALVASLVGV